jgi:hypothetical protein
MSSQPFTTCVGASASAPMHADRLERAVPRMKFLTRSPLLLLSLASRRPNPCGYFLVRFVQFLSRRGMRSPAAGAVVLSIAAPWSASGCRCPELALRQSRATALFAWSPMRLARKTGGSVQLRDLGRGRA